MNKVLSVISEGKITGVKELTNEQQMRINLELKKIWDFTHDQELFTITELNYEEIFATLEDYYTEAIDENLIYKTNMEYVALDINRRIINYLSSFRMYLDHIEHILKKTYGKEGEEFAIFKAACAKEYDTHFSYRFLYKLRNYSQHCGLPMGGIEVNNSFNEVSNEVITNMVIYFSRDALLNNYDSWGKPVRCELEIMAEKIEVNEYLNELQTSIETIQDCLIRIRLPKLIESIKYINELIKPLSSHIGSPCIIDVSNMEPNGGNLNVKWIPISKVQDIISLMSKNGIYI